MAEAKNIRTKREGFQITEGAVLEALKATRTAEGVQELGGKTAEQHLIEGIRSRVTNHVLARSEGAASEVAARVLADIEKVIPELAPGTPPEARWAKVREVLDAHKPKRKTRRRGGRQLDEKFVH